MLLWIMTVCLLSSPVLDSPVLCPSAVEDAPLANVPLCSGAPTGVPGPFRVPAPFYEDRRSLPTLRHNEMEIEECPPPGKPSPDIQKFPYVLISLEAVVIAVILMLARWRDRRNKRQKRELRRPGPQTPDPEWATITARLVGGRNGHKHGNGSKIGHGQDEAQVDSDEEAEIEPDRLPTVR